MTTFKEFERHGWEQKAEAYQDTWGKVTTQVVPTVLRATRLRAGDRLLDIGCGPGHLCQAAHTHGIQTVGIDYSQKMTEIAKANYPELNFFFEDAEHVSFVENYFDSVTLNYVLLHVPDQRRALQEARRVLKPGGRLVFTMWLPPQHSAGFNLIFNALNEHADMSVIPQAEDIFLFADPEFASHFLNKFGFVDSRIEIFEGFWKFPDGESFFSAIQAGIRIGGLIELQTPSAKMKIKDSLLQGMEKFAVAEGYSIPTPSLVISAEKTNEERL